MHFHYFPIIRFILGDQKKVEQEIRKGIDVNIKSPEGFIALHVTAEYGELKKLLL